MKRFCICVLYDTKGIVGDYVITYLKGLQTVCQKVFVVVNGDITEEGKQKLSQILPLDENHFYIRENKGLDFGAWKDSIAKIGYEEFKEYDELVLTNTTCYGPIYPFSEMFEEMEKRDCDFWGITKHPEIKRHNKIRLNEHIQSYFVVFNKNVFLHS